eukprot:GHVR01052080.1.p1 GENE.GHVR01052080.1~~GHVR01052080.1.p1  ORF type:complete len:142 (-),score=3.23 GHVR01052080.1:431-856(-)
MTDHEAVSLYPHPPHFWTRFTDDSMVDSIEPPEVLTGSFTCFRKIHPTELSDPVLDSDIRLYDIEPGKDYRVDFRRILLDMRKQLDELFNYAVIWPERMKTETKFFGQKYINLIFILNSMRRIQARLELEKILKWVVSLIS